MAPTLNQQSTFHLIEYFKEEPCLWDFNNDDYNKKNKRAAALRRIIEKMEEHGEKLSGNFFILSVVFLTSIYVLFRYMYQIKASVF